LHLQHLKGHAATWWNMPTTLEHSATSAKNNFIFLSKKNPHRAGEDTAEDLENRFWADWKVQKERVFPVMRK